MPKVVIQIEGGNICDIHSDLEDLEVEIFELDQTEDDTQDVESEAEEATEGLHEIAF